VFLWFQSRPHRGSRREREQFERQRLREEEARRRAEIEAWHSLPIEERVEKRLARSLMLQTTLKSRELTDEEIDRLRSGIAREERAKDHDLAV